MTTPDATQLHQFLVEHFNVEELKTLCFNLGVEYEGLGGEGRSDKARELVKAMQRQVHLEHLVAHLSITRPDAYRQRFHETPAIPAAPIPGSPAPLADRRIHEKTGIELIRIPAGPFLYGSADSDEMASDDEKPQQTVEQPEYWIGRAPVTNAQFARFVEATRHWTRAELDGHSWGWTDEERDRRIRRADWRHPRGPETSINGKNNHPVVQINWGDANMFCDWAGLALPTEEQWEKAARGTDGRIWPWGNEPPTAEHCNFNRNVGETTPVGQYSPKGDSPYSCVDMAGNVWEWVGSWYLEGRRRPWRGGAWKEDAQYTRAACRYINQTHYTQDDVGFRVVELLADSGF